MTNKLPLFIVLALPLTSVALATEVSSFMTDTKHTFYVKTEKTSLSKKKNSTKVSFEITASRFTENYAQQPKKNYFLLSQLYSSKVSQFEQGTLYLKDSHLRFNLAFWSQGKLVLRNTSGVINQQRFNAPEIIFNKKTMEVSAKKVTFIDKQKISRKRNFQQYVEAITYPYQQIPFYNSYQANNVN